MAAQKTKVVLLACGSFNPITNMHLRMFELARDYLEDTGMYTVVKGIISPVGDGYAKKGLIEGCHRLEMARLATESSKWITVDGWELQQPSWMETVKVVRHHHAKLISSCKNNNNGITVRCERGELEHKIICRINITSTLKKADTPHLMLLCGGDFLESFGVPNLWTPEDIEEIVGQYGVVCINRSGSDIMKCISSSNILSRHHGNIHVVEEWVTNNISATHVRFALSKGRSVRYLLPDPVVQYIQDHGLYKESKERNTDVILAPLQKYTSTKCCWVPEDNNVISEPEPLRSEDLTDPAGPSAEVAGCSNGIDQGGMDASPETPEENSPIENTKVKNKKKNKFWAFFKKLFRISA